MSPASTNKKLERLRDRAECLSRVRTFFASKGVLEVDVPLLSFTAPVDVHIDLVEGRCMGRRCFLHSSPEYGMKRLLAMGSGDIYQLSHVYRDEEEGAWHNPAFLMAEWYRVGMDFDAFIDETVDFVRLFLPEKSLKERLTYAEAFEKYTSKDYRLCEDVDYHFAFDVEPHLGKEGITAICGYPPDQAALAQVVDGLAMRFELFIDGVELCNGYYELLDPIEQRRRLVEANFARAQKGKTTYPIDEAFLEALAVGMPDCAGVAVGVDRLLMLRHGCSDIGEVLPLRGTER